MTKDQLLKGIELKKKMEDAAQTIQIAQEMKCHNSWDYVIERVLTVEEKDRLQAYLVRMAQRRRTALEVQLQTL